MVEITPELVSYIMDNIRIIDRKHDEPLDESSAFMEIVEPIINIEDKLESIVKDCNIKIFSDVIETIRLVCGDVNKKINKIQASFKYPKSTINKYNISQQQKKINMYTQNALMVVLKSIEPLLSIVMNRLINGNYDVEYHTRLSVFIGQLVGTTIEIFGAIYILNPTPDKLFTYYNILRQCGHNKLAHIALAESVNLIVNDNITWIDYDYNNDLTDEWMARLLILCDINENAIKALIKYHFKFSKKCLIMLAEYVIRGDFDIDSKHAIRLSDALLCAIAEYMGGYVITDKKFKEERQSRENSYPNYLEDVITCSKYYKLHIKLSIKYNVLNREYPVNIKPMKLLMPILSLFMLGENNIAKKIYNAFIKSPPEMLNMHEQCFINTMAALLYAPGGQGALGAAEDFQGRLAADL
jgi:hypothetical protein